MSRKSIISFVVLLLTSFSIMAQSNGNFIVVETKTLNGRTFIEITENVITDNNQAFLYVTWKMQDGSHIDLKIPRYKIEYHPSSHGVSYIEFEFDYQAVQRKIEDIEDTIVKMKIYS